MTRVAIIGLANSHPFTDARHLLDLRPDLEFLLVADEEPAVARFLDEHPQTVRCEALTDAISAQPEVALVTLAPTDVAECADALLNAGIPVAITKPAITSAAELARLDEVAKGREERVFTASVLRFAADLSRVPGSARYLRVVANHDISYWLNPESRWQDDAGGLIPMMGVHALEILERLVGPTLRVTDCSAIRVRHEGLRSADFARGRASASGVEAEFVIDGTREGQSYEVTWATAEGSETIDLAGSGGDDPLGFRASARHVLAMADGEPSPIPWVRTRAVLQAIADAVALAEGGSDR